MPLLFDIVKFPVPYFFQHNGILSTVYEGKTALKKITTAQSASMQVGTYMYLWHPIIR